MGWDAYFESLFQRIDRKALDADKKRYQGSDAELDDLIAAYNESKGDFEQILTFIPHSTNDDEPRLKQAIEKLIAENRLAATKSWNKSSGDSKAAHKRKKASAQEAKEAEEAAKELGVWDEFYGSGERGARKKGKKDKEAGDAESGLQALILKRQREREGGLDALAAKYAKLEESKKSKRKAKGKVAQEDSEPPEVSAARGIRLTNERSVTPTLRNCRQRCSAPRPRTRLEVSSKASAHPLSVLRLCRECHTARPSHVCILCSTLEDRAIPAI